MTQVKTSEKFTVTIVNIIWSFDVQTKKVLVLLVKNALGTNIDHWGLPATLLRSSEDAEDASLRLIREKMGIELPEFYTEQLATFSNVKRVSDQREIALTYMTYLPYKPELTPGYGAKEVAWFAVDYLPEQFRLSYHDVTFKTLNEKISANDFYRTRPQTPPIDELASDHALILRSAFQRITNRLDYLPTILLILGDSFTLKQAREVYATFWKEPVTDIDNSNFRKTHAHLFSEMGMEHGKSGRPAKLYKLS